MTVTRGCIDTICLSWWWARCARNMWRVINRNKYIEKNSCITLVIYKESSHPVLQELRTAQRHKYKSCSIKEGKLKSSVTLLFMHEFLAHGQFICPIMLCNSYHHQEKILASIAANIWGKPAQTIPFTHEENPILSYHIARIWRKRKLFSTDSSTQIS